MIELKTFCQQQLPHFKTLGYAEPALELELLLAAALKVNRAWIISHQDYLLSEQQAEQLQSWVERRLLGEPLAYLQGYWEFFGQTFKVNSHTLIPRPETELLVESMLSAAKATDTGTVIDIGTGSGCIVVSLAKQLGPVYHYYGLDVSSEALNVAADNAKTANQPQIEFHQSDLLTYFLQQPNLLKDCQQLLIAANLPYVPEVDLVGLNQPETIGLNYEPRLALAGGADGLDYYRQLKTQVDQLLALYPDLKLKLWMEIQPGQAELMTKIFDPANTELLKDLANKDRLIIYHRH